MRSLYLIKVPILLLMANLAFGQDSSPCPTLNSSEAILKCALEKHPKIIRNNASISISKEHQSLASQRPNPDFDMKTTYGTQGEDKVSTNEVSFTYTWELGGKRDSRINKALTEIELSQVEKRKVQEEVYIEISKSLYRIRQLREEKHAIIEALETFNKIQKQFKSRPSLTPEQEVSLSVFQLAEADYKLRLTSLEADETALIKGIELAIGGPFPSEIKTVLPSFRKEWPNLSEKKDDTIGSELRLAESAAKNAEANLQLARSEGWPDLKIGPTIQQQNNGSSTGLAYGLNLSIPLPLFHTNDGGKAVASAELAKATQDISLKKEEISNEHQRLVQHYQKCVNALSNSPSIFEIEKNHKRIEERYAQGLVSSPLIIEAHRQIIDIKRTLNEHEIDALESLMKIKTLEGKLIEEGI